MPRPGGAAQALGELLHLHIRLVPRRIHGRGLGGVEHVDPGLPGQARVPVQVPGIAPQIFLGPELGGIDKEAHHQAVAAVLPYSIRLRCPRWKKPMVGTRTTFRPWPRHCRAQACISLGVADDLHKKTPDRFSGGLAALRVSVRLQPDPSSGLKTINFYHIAENCQYFVGFSRVRRPGPRFSVGLMGTKVHRRGPRATVRHTPTAGRRFCVRRFRR